MNADDQGRPSDITPEEFEKAETPYIEWVIYENLKGLSREAQWERACKTRKREAFDQLLEQLKGPFGMAPGARQVLILLTYRPAPTRPKTQDEIILERIWGEAKPKKPEFAEGQTLFLVPFKFSSQAANKVRGGSSR